MRASYPPYRLRQQPCSYDNLLRPDVDNQEGNLHVHCSWHGRSESFLEHFQIVIQMFSLMHQGTWIKFCKESYCQAQLSLKPQLNLSCSFLPSSASTSTKTLAEVSFNLHFSSHPHPPDQKSIKSLRRSINLDPIQYLNLTQLSLT